MLPNMESFMTRRHFLASTTLAVGAACFAPGRLFADSESLVESNPRLRGSQQD